MKGPTVAAMNAPPTPSGGAPIGAESGSLRWRRRCAWLIVFGAGVGLAEAREAELIDSREIFLTHCAPCHGPDGRARTPAARKLGVKDLTGSKLDDAEIRRQILDGRNDKAGKPQMPPFKDKLNPDEVSALIAEVKKFRK